MRKRYLLAVLLFAGAGTGMVLIPYMGGKYQYGSQIAPAGQPPSTVTETLHVGKTSLDLDEDALSTARETLESRDLWYYSQLTEAERVLFVRMYISVSSRAEKVEFPDGLDVQTLTRMVYLLRFEFPEFFYLGDRFDYEVKNGRVCTYYPAYVVEEDEAERMQNEIDGFVDSLRPALAEMSDVYILQYLHDRLTEVCMYDDEGPNASGMYGALIEGRANCSGYSAAMLYLLRAFGLKGGQVIGTVEDSGQVQWHSWNFAECGGQTVYLDPTWDDLDPAYAEFGLERHYGFFGLSRAEMARTHDLRSNEEYLGAPPEAPAGFGWYRQKGQYAADLETAGKIIRRSLPSAAAQTGGWFVLQCSDGSVYQSVRMEMQNLMQQEILHLGLDIGGCSYLRIDKANMLIVYNLS